MKKALTDRSDKFYYSVGDVVFSDEVGKIEVSRNLEEIIDKIPQDGEQALRYLQSLVKNNTITIDDFRNILLHRKSN